MKTKIITGLKKEVLVIEAKSKDIACGFIFNKYGVKELLKWEVLGSPDEIKEEDLDGIVSDFDAFQNTGEGIGFYDYKKRFFDIVEKEIYWVNPLGNKRPSYNDYGSLIQYKGDCKDFDEAQEKTFDRNKTLIFVKD